jgi:SSS family solute:Na+ symporter
MPELFETQFTAIDWVIIAAYLGGALVVGIIANRYIHTAAGYIVGGRAAGTALNVATYTGTGLGLVTLMYAAIDGLSHGFSYVVLALISAGIGLFLGSTGFVIRRLREMKLLTIPEYFEHRYSRSARVIAGSICAIAGILNMGLFPKMGATFITYATGLGAGGADHATLVNIITTLLIILVLVYTILGGMVSVIVTDYIQYVVLSLGMGVAVWFCLTHPELGWERITTTMAEHRGERMFNPVAEGGYGWWWIVFNMLVFFAGPICWAPEATRTLTARSERTAMRTFLVSVPSQFARLAVPTLWAAAAFAIIAASPMLTEHFFPDGLAADPVPAHAAQAMPLALGKIIPTGMLGILVAGLLAAFMSTHDSYLLGWASIITRDVVAPLRRRPLTERRQVLITRLYVLGIGAFLLVWGIWYELPPSVWTYIGVTGTIYFSGALVCIIGGMYWKRASTAGAIAALLGGTVAVIGLFQKSINELFGLNLESYQLALFSYLVTLTLFVVFSLLMPDRPAPQPQTEGAIHE